MILPNRPRTLNELQYRIAFLQDRMERYIERGCVKTEYIAKVVDFERQTIDNLKGQLRNRQEWLLKCMGC